MLKRKFEKIKAIEWTSYVWLAYLPYSISMFVPAKKVTDFFWLIMLFAFLVLYILVVEKNVWRRWTMPAELIVTGLFSLFAANDYLIIFPGWQIPFILGRRPKREFGWFISGYYAFLFGGLVLDYLKYPQFFDWQNGALMGLMFPLISPFLAYAFSRSMWRQRQLHQDNRRLETIIQRNERERIARDLHDTLGQSFSMITLKTELAKKLLVKAPEQVASELDDIEQTSRQNLQLVRSIVNDLHEQSLSEVLVVQSRNLATAHIWLVTTGEAAATKWPTKIQGRFAAVMVEAITNVIRHAHAQQVAVVFELTETMYQVVIQDDGRGSQLKREGANGIPGMQARMVAHGGTFDISSSKRGTKIVLTLPKERSK